MTLKDIANIAIHCPTEEDSIACMEFLRDLDENIHWAGSGLPPGFDYLNRGAYGDHTCYRVHSNGTLQFGSYEWYKQNEFTIIKLDDLIETEETSEPILPKEERFKLLSELL